LDSIYFDFILLLKKMIDSDHECGGFTSPQGKIDPGQHQAGNTSPDEAQTIYFQEPLRGFPRVERGTSQMK
jgi:hypothetical protein